MAAAAFFRGFCSILLSPGRTGSRLHSGRPILQGSRDGEFNTPVRIPRRIFQHPGHARVSGPLAADVQEFCLGHGWRFCFIGGLAVQRWSEPRFTKHVDHTLLTGIGSEEEFVDALLARYEPRRDDAREFALLNRVLLLRDPNGIGIDVALGALPFEESAVNRAIAVEAYPGIFLQIWMGHERYWSVKDGEIVGKNMEKVDVSTYLLTERKFTDFRLTFEFKLAQAEMHSGLAMWGRVAPEEGDEYTYAGHLVMFPSNYGFYDLYGRKMIHKNAAIAKAAGKQHDWNKIEILAQGNRIRVALNGVMTSDWREPEPGRIKAAPIGLQLHSNKVPQEVRWRNFSMETYPGEDRLLIVTAES